MTSTYAYPPDEFDQPHEDRPRSTHRAPRSWWSRWGAFVVVLLLFPLLAFGGVMWLSSWQGTAPADLPVFTGDDPEDEEPTGTEEPADPGDPEGESPEPEPEPEPDPEPDLTRPVLVLNAAGVQGLAGAGAQVLSDAGFTDTTVGNWTGTPPPEPVVLYGDPADEVTARAVAQALGIAQVEQGDGLAAPLVVGLAPGYQVP